MNVFYSFYTLLNSSTSTSKEIDLETLELEVNNDLQRDEDFPLDTFSNFLFKKNKDKFKKELFTYLPFLPLSKQHIKQCIELDLKKDYSEFSHNGDTIQTIINMLDYEPAEVNFYSTSGCKRIHRLIRDFFTN
jgi:hypothetical protein